MTSEPSSLSSIKLKTDRRVLWAVLAALGLLALGLALGGKVREEIAPEPRASWVAVEIDDEGVARTGRSEVQAGTPFRLHAVLEAETWRGERIFYTEASSLEVDGIQIPQDQLRPWRREGEPRILWFSVEGYRPYFDAGELPLAEFRFEEHLRPDWPRAWVVPGDLTPRAERLQQENGLGHLPRFGTQRFHVRVEFFDRQSQIVPRQRFRSTGAADLPSDEDQVATVVSILPNELEIASSYYGLSQIAIPPSAPSELVAQVVTLQKHKLAFAKLALLRDHLAAAGTTYPELDWRSVDLEEGPVWGGRGVGPGDVLRVGERWVILASDEGRQGVLDTSDLCLDFDRGARIRAVGDVFTGDGLIDWGSIHSPALTAKETEG